MTWWKAIANAIAHDELAPFLQVIYLGCERCGNPHLIWISHEEEPPVNELEDIILQSRYFFKCPECGFEEANQITTIIPSWQWHQYREKMPKTGVQVFKEKISLAKLWRGER